MTIDEKYMHRCLQLALNGKGLVSPNPMVGAVIVHQGKIIGEGYHRKYGQPHAEVNAIDSVKDKSLLSESVIYVSLEPCSHYGKTPPCSQLIIDHKIPRVVVACLDPYPAVSGRGVKMLQDAGIEVTLGVLEKEAKELNKEFITTQLKDRPYIYLKWAQSGDGFIDAEHIVGEQHKPTQISNSFTRILVHKMRSEVSAIMVGTNTAVNDNPSLTTRFWSGDNPIRIVLDKTGRIPSDYVIFDNNIETLVFTEAVAEIIAQNKITYIPVAFDSDLLRSVFSILKERKITSVLIEGGRMLLQSIIDQQLWDEAYVEVAPMKLGKGTKAPSIEGYVLNECSWLESKQIHLGIKSM